MIKKYLSLKVILALLISLLVFPVTACEGNLDGEPALTGEEEFANGKDDDSMTSEQSFPEYTVPPIDQNVPENLETATLALG